MIYDLISPQELLAIHYYRQCNVSGGDSLSLCPEEKLLIPWAEAKSEYLSKIFGDKLILKRKISIAEPEGLIKEKIDENLIYHQWRDHFSPSKTKSFYLKYVTMMSDYYMHGSLYMDNECAKQLLRNMESLYSLSKNRFIISGMKVNEDKPTETFKIKTKSGSSITISTGMKLMKVVRKVSEALEIDGYEDFILTHSQILNTAKLEGTMCLSIHPLDYMTMSDNMCDWSSCMSWEKDGEYKQGTVEMMNSPCIVVGYLESSTPMTIDGMEWNSKKFRSLYFVNDKLIANIKGYPYQSRDIDDFVISWLKELCEANCGWQFDNKIIDFNSDKNSYNFSLYTNIMYNDCYGGKNDYGMSNHHGYIADVNQTDFEYNYSGKNQCMACGTTGVMDNCWEGSLTCNNCDGKVMCSYCGDRHWPDDMHEVDGETICEYCYDNYTFYDFTEKDKELHLESNCCNIYISVKRAWAFGIDNYNFVDFHIYDDNLHKLREEFFTKDTLLTKDMFKPHTTFTVTWQQLTEKGWKFFYPNKAERKQIKQFCETQEKGIINN